MGIQLDIVTTSAVAHTGEPDDVVALCVNPADENQLLIGYEFGGALLWQLSMR